MPTPFLLLGDGPSEPTGLGRIARDLTAILLESGLPLDLCQVGGPSLPPWTHWKHLPLPAYERDEDWGVRYVEHVWQGLWGRSPGILMGVWDPSRLYPYLNAQIPAQKWAYTAIDSENCRAWIGGPAQDVLRHFDRILAYTRWGSQVIKRSGRDRVSYLPHGVMLETFSEPISDDEVAWATSVIGPDRRDKQTLIGCVATNQARKDLGLFFLTLTKLKERGHKIYGWLHTDTLVKDWSINQLVEDCGLAKQITVTLERFTDRQLACLYRACSVTIAPGLGEGFGYPLVESLASGVPVVHGDFGGGAELVPKIEWRFPVREVRLDSVYALKRPVFRADDVANAVERVWSWQAEMGSDTAAAYCKGSVAHLEWTALKDRWIAWVRQGLDG